MQENMICLIICILVDQHQGSQAGRPRSTCVFVSDKKTATRIARVTPCQDIGVRISDDTAVV